MVDKPQDYDQVILSIGEGFLRSRNLIKVPVDALKYQMPCLGRLLIFRDRGKVDEILNCKIFELMDIQ